MCEPHDCLHDGARVAAEPAVHSSVGRGLLKHREPSATSLSPRTVIKRAHTAAAWKVGTITAATCPPQTLVLDRLLHVHAREQAAVSMTEGVAAMQGR